MVASFLSDIDIKKIILEKDKKNISCSVYRLEGLE
jgi:hypothetical protein